MNQDAGYPPLEASDWPFRNMFETANDGMIILDIESGLPLEANPTACQMHGYKREEFMRLKLVELAHHESRYGLNETIRTFQLDGRFDILTQQVRRDASTFYAEWRGTAFQFQGRACLLVIIRDVSNRIRVEQLLHQREETRALEQAKLLEISHILASTLEFQPGVILDQLREIVNFNVGGLFELQATGLSTVAISGGPKMQPSFACTHHFKNPEYLASLFNAHQPVRIDDVWGDNSQAQILRSLIQDWTGDWLQGMHSWMWVPLGVENRVIAGLGLAHEKPNYFTPHHADLALSIANQAAITMTNAKLYEQAQALAVLEERQRLARNLHDAVNQSLFSAGLIAEVLPRLWKRDQEDAQRSLEDLLRLTRGAQAEMRALLAELRPSTLIDSSLSDLLRLLGNALSGRANIPVALNITGNFTLPSDVQVAFYRICQEAFFNVAKHSKADAVEVSLDQVGSDIEMRIRDNGVGFDPKQLVAGHYGLGMMRERADAVGARLTVFSNPGQGADIFMSWTKIQPQEVV